MNIFDFRDALTHDYAEYVRSFIRVGTDDVRGTVDEALDNQLLWPEPIVQLNPAYEPGGYVRDLVRDGVLHPTAATVFQRGKERTPSELGQDLRLYRHQVTAIETARTRHHEEGLVAAANDLKYLVFDELHTYRGRQGADVAMLIRRVRERMGGPSLPSASRRAAERAQAAREHTEGTTHGRNSCLAASSGCIGSHDQDLPGPYPR
jgi:ATP-dependent helicase YprA (DUF1998 family)